MSDPVSYGARPRPTGPRLPDGSTPACAMHFGGYVNAPKGRELRISRDTYAQINRKPSNRIRREDVSPEIWAGMGDIYEDDDHRIYTEEWCLNWQAAALENFDLNMAYFRRLDHDEFNTAITKTLTAQRGMVEVTDLNEWDGIPGLYLMVLDDYSQAYVGQTAAAGGVSARIQRHWRTKHPFDRLLFGRVGTSVMAIDSFQALDTTRIFALEDDLPHGLENDLIDAIPAKFLLNRLAGGSGNAVGFGMMAGLEMKRFRDLVDHD